MNNYSDIINLPYSKSTMYKQMSLLDRANQFAPFAALHGHEEDVIETSRLTDKKIILSEDQKVLLNQKLQFINDHLDLELIIKMTYFVKDTKKSGGAYITREVIIKRIDEIECKILFKDNSNIKIDDLFSIENEYLDKICF